MAGKLKALSQEFFDHDYATAAGAFDLECSPRRCRNAHHAERAPGRMPGSFRRSLRARLVASFLAVLRVTVLVVGAIVYLRATDDLTASVYDRLDAVAGIKADALDRWIDEQTRNVVFIGVMPGVGDDARTFSTRRRPRPTAHGRRRSTAGAPRDGGRADGGCRGDLHRRPAGTIKLSTLAGHEGTSVATRAFFTDGLRRTRPSRTPIDRRLTGRPTITVATPLFDQDGKGQRVAVMAANLSLAATRPDRRGPDRPRRDRPGVPRRAGRASDPGHAPADGRSGPSIRRAVDAVVAAQSGRGLYADATGAPVIGVYRGCRDRRRDWSPR